MKKLLPALIVSVILAVAGYALAVSLGGGESAVGFGAISPVTWSSILFLSLVNYALRFVRWQWYMRALSGVTVPLWRHVLIYFSAFALTTTPGKAGEIIRSLYLKPLGISLSQSVSGLFVERLIDMFAIVLLSVYALASYGNETLKVSAVIIVAIVFMTLPLLHFRPLWLVIERHSSRLPAPLQRVVLKLCHLVQDSARILKNRHLYGGLLIGFVAWFCEGLGFYVLLQALDVKLTVPMAVGVYSSGMLAGAISFMPGGLGGAEAAMTWLLLTLGTAKPVAILATVVCRIATLWFAVALGALACLWLTARKIYPQWNSVGAES